MYTRFIMPLLSLLFRPFVTNSCRLSQKFGSLGINSTANWKCDTTTDPDVFWVKP